MDPRYVPEVLLKTKELSLLIRRLQSNASGVEESVSSLTDHLAQVNEAVSKEEKRVDALLSSIRRRVGSPTVATLFEHLDEKRRALVQMCIEESERISGLLLDEAGRVSEALSRLDPEMRERLGEVLDTGIEILKKYRSEKGLERRVSAYLKDKSNIVGHMQRRVDRERDEIDQVREKVKTWESEYFSTKRTIILVEHKIDTIRSKIRRETEDTNRLERDLAALWEEIRALEGENRGEKEEAGEIKFQILDVKHPDDSRKDSKSNNSSAIELERMILDLRKQKAQLEKTIKELEHQIKELGLLSSSLSTKGEVLSSEYKKLARTSRDLDKEILKIKEALVRASRQFTSIKKKSLRTIKQLEKARKSHEEQRKKLIEEIREERKKRLEQERILWEKKSLVSASEEDAKDVSDSIPVPARDPALDEAVERVNREIKDQETENALLFRENERITEQIEKAKEIYEKEKRRKEGLIRELSSLSSEVEREERVFERSLQEEKEKMERRKREVLETLSAKKKTLESLLGKVKKGREELRPLREQYEKLSEKVDLLDTRMESIQERTRALEGDIKRQLERKQKLLERQADLEERRERSDKIIVRLATLLDDVRKSGNGGIDKKRREI